MGEGCRVGAMRIDLGARRLKGERRGRVQGKSGRDARGDVQGRWAGTGWVEMGSKTRGAVKSIG